MAIPGTIDNGGIACAPATHCALCGGEGDVLHRDLVDHLFDAPGEWAIRRCAAPGCGLGWVDPQPLLGEIGELYAGYYTHGAADGAGGRQSYVTPGWRGAVKRLLGTVLFWKSAVYRTDYFHLGDMPPGRVLEIGCGNGDFLRAIAERGWRATGIDFDAAAVAAARSLPGVEARQGTLIEQRFDEASFDAIVMNNVIEHVPDPAETIAECRRILRPGGRLVAITPNLDSFGHAAFGPDWRGLEPPRHLYLFSPATLRRMARDAGFGRIQAFTSTGGGAVWGLLQASAEIAAKSGRSAPAESAAAIVQREKRAVALGRPAGEWAVLVATR